LTIDRTALAFGVTYMAISMAIEIVLLVVVGLRIPQDNARIATILLTVSPIAAAVICGLRRPKTLIAVAVATVVLTIAGVMVFGRIMGISTGIGPPIVIRTLAGFLAAALSNRLIGR
jgi:hypothetical protein